MTDTMATWSRGYTVPVVPLVPVALFADVLAGPIGTNGAIGTRFRYSECSKRTLAAVHDRRLCRPNKPATGTNDAIGTGYLSQPQAIRTGRVVRRGPQVSRIGWAIGTNGTIGTEIQIEAYGASILDRAALNSAGLLVTAPLGGEP